VIAYAALDLRGGRVVQLVGGRVEDERVSLADPIGVAHQWIEHGFRALHIVDLDAALGHGSNADAIAEVTAAVAVPVQVGGGIRDDERVAALLESGVSRVVLGTRAIEDRAWLEGVAARWPGRIVVAADSRDGTVVTRGWTESAGIRTDALLKSLDTVPLGAVLVTDVGREGLMAGVDGSACARLVAASRHPFIASGGVGGVEDLRRLDEAGAAGVVIGMALYTGALDPRATAEAYAA
jgi:phosphoribosylformimino-5-aminoimidazole carboxamide ribotide isomerase